jgi:sulfur-oxidizing protein SoxB
MTGAQIRAVLEDVCDNLFNPDPYYQQGGDMVRVGGLTYACAPRATMGTRISDLRLGGAPLDPARTYKVAGWAPVSEESDRPGGAGLGGSPPTACERPPAARRERPRLIGVAGEGCWALAATDLTPKRVTDRVY